MAFDSVNAQLSKGQRSVEQLYPQTQRDLQMSAYKSQNSSVFKLEPTAGPKSIKNNMAATQSSLYTVQANGKIKQQPKRIQRQCHPQLETSAQAFRFENLF